MMEQAKVRVPASAEMVDLKFDQARTGVFICTCGGSITLNIDVEGMAKAAKEMDSVSLVETTDFLCHPESRARMSQIIAEEKLDRAVVAACSHRIYGKEFIEAGQAGGLAGCLVDMANIREQCAWMHSENRSEATRKAEDTVRMAVAKVAAKSPSEEGSVAMVKEEGCSGCGVCQATCRVNAIKMIDDPERPGKRLASIDQKICEGCGACVAACPSGALDQACFTNAEVSAEIDTATPPVENEEKNFPNVMVFTCQWCSYAAGDMAGIKRLQLPSGFRVIRTMCSARVDPEWVMRAISRGADGVLILAGKPGRCHYEVGSIRTNRRMTLLSAVIRQLGFDEARFKTVFVDSDQPEEYQREITEFIDKIKEIGPSPMRTPTPQGVTVPYQFQGVPQNANVGYDR